MAAKNKLRRFADMNAFAHVIEPPLQEAFDVKTSEIRPHKLAGQWASEFNNGHPIVLELGCGKGEYTVGMARRFREVNFIGVDIKGSRMWVGARLALEEGLSNVRFLRTRIDFIHAFFAPDEVSEIWITFPDPQAERPRKRLTSPMFIPRYRSILHPQGLVHLKTDSDLMFEYTCEEVQRQGLPLHRCYADLYAELPEEQDAPLKDILQIPTHYEHLFASKGHTIHYLSFRLK